MNKKKLQKLKGTRRKLIKFEEILEEFKGKLRNVY